MSKAARWSTQYSIEIQMEVLINKSQCFGSDNSWPYLFQTAVNRWHLNPLGISQRVNAAQKSLSAKCISTSLKAIHANIVFLCVCKNNLPVVSGAGGTSLFSALWQRIPTSSLCEQSCRPQTPCLHSSREASLPSHSTSSNRISPVPSPNTPVGTTSAPPLDTCAQRVNHTLEIKPYSAMEHWLNNYVNYCSKVEKCLTEMFFLFKSLKLLSK